MDRQELCNLGLPWMYYSFGRHPFVMRSVIENSITSKGRFMNAGISLMHEKPETISQRGGDRTEGTETKKGLEVYSEADMSKLKAHM